MRRIFSESWQLIREAIADWFHDKASQQGAALAFYSVLSLAPLVMICLAIARLFLDEKVATTEFLTQMESMVGKEGAAAIGAMIDNSDRPATGIAAASIGLVTLLFGASGVFGQLQDAMNVIWDAKPKPRSSIWAFLRGRFLSMAMVLGTGFLLVISLLLSAAVSGFGNYLGANWRQLEAIIHVLHELILFGLLTVLFAMMFKYLPDTKVAWRDVWLGGLITAVLFTAGKFLIGFYLGTSAVGSAYGAAGSLVVLVVWVYYSSQVLFLGAELAHAQAERRSRAAVRLGRGPASITT